MNKRCFCRHCKPTVQAAAEAPVVHEPIQLPDSARPFRVHHDGRTQDCTLHPDGRLTMTAADQEWVSALSFDEMRVRNWADAHIEWDPTPLETPEPEPEAEQPVQAALDLAS
ncbi:hypothetical protein ACF06X_33640 [Streptomyces sp. NPDC015346]|uniref:hypothetical protein n=1 Tax=Streptomyces sp. NPDC015346 TaxID=3364954 RepID=UPI0036F53E9B